MKFGIFYEHQLPRPSDGGVEVPFHLLTTEIKPAIENLPIQRIVGRSMVRKEHFNRGEGSPQHFRKQRRHRSAPELRDELKILAKQQRIARLQNAEVGLTPKVHLNDSTRQIYVILPKPECFPKCAAGDQRKTKNPKVIDPLSGGKAISICGGSFEVQNNSISKNVFSLPETSQKG